MSSCLLADQLVAQRLAADVGQHVIQEPVRVTRVDQGEDMRMVEPRGDPDFGQEALRAEHGAELGAKDLDGDLSIVLEIVGEIDRGHAALTQLPLDAVAVGEGHLEATLKLGHPHRHEPQGAHLRGEDRRQAVPAGVLEDRGRPRRHPDVSHVATVSHALVPLSASRMTCEARIARPPQTYTGCTLRRVTRSYSTPDSIRRSTTPK